MGYPWTILLENCEEVQATLNTKFLWNEIASYVATQTQNSSEMKLQAMLQPLM